jgi:hypothetical protein
MIDEKPRGAKSRETVSLICNTPSIQHIHICVRDMQLCAYYNPPADISILLLCYATHSIDNTFYDTFTKRILTKRILYKTYTLQNVYSRSEYSQNVYSRSVYCH